MHAQPDAAAHMAAYYHACSPRYCVEFIVLVGPPCPPPSELLSCDCLLVRLQANIEGLFGFTYRRDTRHNFEADHHNTGVESVLGEPYIQLVTLAYNTIGRFYEGYLLQAIFVINKVRYIMIRSKLDDDVSVGSPLASQQALERLERRIVDEGLRGREETFDCVVCKDEMKLGDRVISLHCKHIFHEACGILWLKTSNTCPLCRVCIERNGMSVSHDSLDLSVDDPPTTVMIKEPEIRPVSQDQLINEVKGIYNGLDMVESKCIEVDNAQSSDTKRKLSNERWQARLASYRKLISRVF